MTQQFYLSSSCGNDSVAMLHKAIHRDKIPNITVVYCHTGWASDDWHERIARVRLYAELNGAKFVELNKDGLTFEQLIESKKGFPMPGKTWCSLHLKAIPFLMWADEVDPECKAIVMIGKRRDESVARRETPEYIVESENHGGRMVWHSLAYVTEAERDKLIVDAGFEVLPHRSKECDPCVNANRTDMRSLRPLAISKVIRLEGKIGQNMFRPYHHMGAVGFEEVMRWANSAPGKFEKELPGAGCTEGYCE